MKLGTGYAYLVESVARGDGAAESSPLTRYYAETGTPPGRFLGAGLAAVNDGAGLTEGTMCTEEMLFNMLGLCADPVTGQPLGRRPGASAVAGFDLTFSVPKSISSAWALADAGTQSVIYAAHQEAIRATIAYAEQHSFFSRSGRQGIVQEPIRGVIAAGFDHWDSRASDPQLHTHVVVQNRARSSDSVWRTLDSRALYRQVVTLSELHAGILHDLLTASLGWGWDARTRRHSPVPKWEVAGVSDDLMAEFSQRSEQIKQAKDAYVDKFVAAHGRQPTAVEVLRMRQHRWVKNGDRWRVTATNPDGSMTIRRATGGGEVVLLAGYVHEHVELAYATTAYRAQGATVDTAHALINATTPREVLYVGATRGRELNGIYVDTFYDPDHDTSHGPIPETPVADVLARVLANRGTDLAAHTTAEQAQHDANSLVRLEQEYTTIAKVAEADHWQNLVEHSGLTADQVSDVLASDAYGPLVAALRGAESRGLDVTAALPMLVKARPLADAADIVAVLHGRGDQWGSAAGTSGATSRDRSIVGLIPRARHATDPDMSRALNERAAAMEYRAAQLVSWAIDRHEPWIAALGIPPTEPGPRAEWLREARIVAAFRELHGTTAVSMEKAHTATEAGDARAALAAIERARASANGQTPSGPSTGTEPVVEQIGVQR
jgi:conjugative relaxase-like TrwC/TraI family protein